jgi:hypothetical protein
LQVYASVRVLSALVWTLQKFGWSKKVVMSEALGIGIGTLALCVTLHQ